MVTIRLARFGTKRRPYYHVVVTDSENPRDGRFLEQVGRYDPSAPIEEARIDLGRVAHWIALGAQTSTRVRHVVNDYRRATQATA
ncbi:MAG: 30S ribosomal protein S16 [Myxococcota bacterium]|nr:30S ribosomal protein S16 [Myxococcota bacterium]